jgi:hypothetical protein
LTGANAAAAIDANGNIVNPSLLTSQMQLSYQLVNSGIFPSGTPDSGSNHFNYGYTSQRDPSKNLVEKVDYHLSDKHQISGVFFWSKDTEIGDSQDVVQPYWFTDFVLTAYVARANWTYLPNSNWVNEFHFGFDRKVENQQSLECTPGRGAVPPSVFAFTSFNTGADGCFSSSNPSNFSFPTLTISGFDSLGGVGSQKRVEGYPQFADSLSYASGNHNLKFGFETRHPYWDGAALTNKKGTVQFGTSSIAAFTGATPLQSFLMGLPSNGSIVSGNPIITRRNWAYGAFVQDDWRVTPRVTVNLGMRWEYQTALTEDNNQEAIFDPLSPTGLTQLGQGIKEVWHPSKFASNLQPRVGMVWDVTGKGTTVVRAAWGIYSNWPVWNVLQGLGANPSGAIFYDTLGNKTQGTGNISNANVSFATPSAAAGSTLKWTIAGPVFETGVVKCGNNQNVTTGANAGTKNPGTCNITSIDPKWTVPYLHEWNVGIQRALGSNMSVDIAYVGSHGTNLLGTNDLNMPGVGDNSNTNVLTRRPYYNRGTSGYSYPWFGNISQVTNRDRSNYNALQLTLNQRNWHGLTSTLGYTWAHALDVAGTDLAQAVYPDARNPSGNYGSTPFDIRHRLTVRSTYDLPSKKGYGQMLEGWSISSVLNLQGATPWDTQDATSNFSGTGKAERWDIFGSPKAFNSYGHFDNVPCYGIKASKFGSDSACTPINITIPANTTVTTAMLTSASAPAAWGACVAAAASIASNPAITQSSDITKHTTALNSLADYGCYAAGDSVIVPLAQGTFSNMGKGIFRSSAFRNWDLQFRKNFQVIERLRAQFQFDMYNVTNTPHFAIPGGNGNTSANDLTTPSGFGRSVATPNVSNGNVVGGSGDARRYQFGLKLTF